MIFSKIYFRWYGFLVFVLKIVFASLEFETPGRMATRLMATNKMVCFQMQLHLAKMNEVLSIEGQLQSRFS